MDSVQREIALLHVPNPPIADVVAGKLDVREAAAGLPDESDEPEPLNEAEPEIEDVAADNLDTIPEETEA